VALPSLALLYLAGASLGVRLDAMQWLEMTGLLLAGLAPFVALGIVVGYLVPADALAPAIGGGVGLLALVGGVDGVPLAAPGPVVAGVEAIPSYWVGDARQAPAGRGP